MGLNEKLFKSASAVVPVGDENFDVVLYPGNGGSKTISSLGFPPGFVLIKSRTLQTAFGAYDTVRGATKYISTATTDTEGTFSTVLNAFSSNGFTVGSNPGVNHPNNTFASWCWKASANTTTISANSVGNSIASNVRANQASGFSIVQYQGNAQNATIAHNLSSAPELMIIKSTTVAQNWAVYHKDLGNTYWLQLNTTTAKLGSAPWSVNNPTNNVFSINGSGVINGNNSTNIGYLFHSVPGYQKVGSYTGISSGNVVVTCGFKPRFIMLKNTNDTGNWEILDAIRSPSIYSSNGAGSRVRANDGSSEATFTNSPIKFTNTGFFLDHTVTGNGYVDYDENGDTFIFLAIA